jgi:GT2 family glycosyltransferase
MKVAVIIVTYNAKKWIDSCIKPLSKPSDLNKVYIIDNCSTDGTQEIIKENHPEFVFYQSETNLGFGKANNLGLSMALKDGAEYFLLLNQDAYLSWDDIMELALIHSRNKGYGIISPSHLYDQKHLDHRHYGYICKSRNNLLNDYIVGNNIREIYDIEFSNAAIWMVSKECLKRVGGFDPLFNHYGEDDDYAKRVSFFKFKIGFCPDIKGFHFRPQNKTHEKRTKAFFYKQYLIDLKKIDKNLSKQYLFILTYILISFFLKRNKITKRFSYASLSAFMKLLFVFHKIELSKKHNIQNKYCFINIK